MQPDHERTMVAIESVLGPEEITAAMSEGRALTVDQLVAEALSDA